MGAFNSSAVAAGVVALITYHWRGCCAVGAVPTV